MKLLYKLIPCEAEAIEEIASVYNLPLILEDENESESDEMIVDSSLVSLSDGVDYVLEAINSDDRELFIKRVSKYHQLAFLSLARQLYRTLETSWAGKSLPDPYPELLSVALSRKN